VTRSRDQGDQMSLWKNFAQKVAQPFLFKIAYQHISQILQREKVASKFGRLL
jgi:hypothetical protein